MDEADVAEGSREELQRGLYLVDEKIICDYFQRDQLWRWEMSPVLAAAATLQTMLRTSHASHHQCYWQAIQLLEYIHSQSPQPLGNEVEYVDLLVELKTRVSPGELRKTVYPNQLMLSLTISQ
ncbi:hypothetical protein GBAR_LOCUS9033 [Geodia barretti]|uniref:Uncharacterized protein n=1 Tax=Geodia barretti TaxID=519541 RepID=A0AA35RPG3_GEOBA|nr:hypothetical protein GBAR_LOCUS9033 [Geodia barretti]